MTNRVMHPRASKHPKDFPLKQIEYRSFIKTICLFHYEHSHHPIEEFEKSLPQRNLDYAHRLESTDPFINDDGSEKLPVPDGDEVPAGFTEVAYLKCIFRDPGSKYARSQGSALGFRLLDEDRIEWFCFDRAIDDILKVQTKRGPLFDLVGYIDRGDPDVNYKGKASGHPEHRLWYEGLQNAEEPLFSLQTIETNRRRPLRGKLVPNKDGLWVEHEKAGDNSTDSEGSESEEDEDMEDSVNMKGSEAQTDVEQEDDEPRPAAEGEESDISEEL